MTSIGNAIEAEARPGAAAEEAGRDEPLGAGPSPKRIERKAPSERAAASDKGQPTRIPAALAPSIAPDDRSRPGIPQADSFEPDDDAPEISLAAELAAARSTYGARIAAARLTLPKADRAAGVRALRDELRAATREITERRRASTARRKAKRLQRQTAETPKLEK